MTDETKYRAALAENRQFFASGKRYTVAQRRRALRGLHTWLSDEQERLIAALNTDLGKSEYEARTSELIPLLESLKFMIRRLPRLARKRRAAIGLFNWPGRGQLRSEPYGQVLIFSTWNYPLLLALDPVIAALGAGNRVVLKLSPQAPATAAAVTELLEKCFTEGEVTVAPRDAHFDFLFSEKFDYIFFTGGGNAGREVYRRAAETLTPVTLELGGKSPCVVDESADLKVAARRIAWGKFLNAGQTCVAPDYLLVHRKIKDALMNELHEALRAFFGDNPAERTDYPRIVNEMHFKRLERLLSAGRLIAGGEKNRTTLYIAPTVIDRVSPDDPVMQEEIFGPILPVLEVNSMAEAAAFINARPKPLALYYFGRNRRNRDFILDSTSSGGAAVNETVMQLMAPGMPFGGVGASGIGTYHGRYGFDTFSHLKPVLIKGSLGELPLRYPPYGEIQKWIARLLCKRK